MKLNFISTNAVECKEQNEFVFEDSGYNCDNNSEEDMDIWRSRCFVF